MTTGYVTSELRVLSSGQVKAVPDGFPGIEVLAEESDGGPGR